MKVYRSYKTDSTAKYIGMEFTAGNNISLVVSTNGVDEVKKIFNKLKFEGTEAMELQE